MTLSSDEMIKNHATVEYKKSVKPEALGIVTSISYHFAVSPNFISEEPLCPIC